MKNVKFLLVIYFSILCLSCNKQLFVDKSRIVYKSKGIIIFTGNSGDTYHNYFIEYDGIQKNYLNNFFASKRNKADEVFINTEQRDMFTYVFCDTFENEIITRGFTPRYKTFFILPVEIEYMELEKIKNVPAELDFDIQVHLKVENKETILDVISYNEKRIINVNPIMEKTEYIRRYRLYTKRQKEIEEQLSPCYEKILNEN